MEFLIIAFFAVMLLFLGFRKLWEWSKAGEQALTEQPQPQQPLFMSSALDVSDKLSRGLAVRMEARSLEIAKADGRFLVTPEDMRGAYQEIIREEHM